MAQMCIAILFPVGGEGGVPTPPIYYPPSSPGYPAHPIAPGGPPPGIWPSPGHPAHPIVLPPEGGTVPPGIWPSPGYPTHPIAPGGPPPGVWPGPGVPPGVPGHPIAPGGGPSNPIVIPPEVWPPEPPAGLPPGAVWPPLGVVVWVPGYGWATFPTTPEPPTAQPK
jgi:hypothetical protein